MQIELYHGAAIEPHIPGLARLRISVFREFPYLYDGTLAYEAQYLATYTRSANSLCVIVRSGQMIVGAATALPLADETDNVKMPFLAAGYDVNKVFYFGESLLLPAFRGLGFGKRFFAEREGHARRLGHFDWCGFCAIQRPADHPRQPPGYYPLHGLWRAQGFEPHPELRAEFNWQDLDERAPSVKPMVFWLKRL
ncbi:GNAT family N-acetyltransferase [Pseudomonas typographi]|uniref:GNAT family N-acetyltransferase n=1 Tax=Pseudomonas typographi TaxID=2715964 RepID=A0ABR7Z3G8_9PSED|nr:GNAT family N-acetyltransferase [Pseudomonas typographi]MBD1551966.1 GNAT family N-acetyltransferase [Pseudomonas typographi]MBD1586530.1 GNAT family N-acetyltransferase [Pseudomonas typographi]MBD1600031.1 GNAT family N-acetyltransferase [Pseudomonas typographi]